MTANQLHEYAASGDGNRRLLHERIIGVTVIPDGDFDTTLEKPHTKPKPAPSQKEEASQASNNAAGTGADDGKNMLAFNIMALSKVLQPLHQHICLWRSFLKDPMVAFLVSLWSKACSYILPR